MGWRHMLLSVTACGFCIWQLAQVLGYERSSLQDFLDLVAPATTSTLIRRTDENKTTTTTTTTAKPPRKKNELPVVDSTLYNGEPIVLVRLELLYDVVDRFYITESPVTYSGQPKPIYSKQHIEEFAPYQDKITWLLYEPAPNTTGAWTREFEQRMFAVKQMQQDVDNQQLATPFVVINTDADELVNPDLIDMMQPGGPYHDDVISRPMYLEMDWFMYNLNWIKTGKWDQSHVLPGHKVLDGTYTLQSERHWRKARFGSKLPNSGWHLTYFLSIDDIVRKIESFSHQELNKPRWKDPARIESHIREGKDLYDRRFWTEILLPHNNTDQLPIPLQRFHNETMAKQGVAFD